MTPTPANPFEQWSSISDTSLTLDIVRDLLGQIQDDLWVAAACVDRIVDDISMQRALLQTGLARTELVVGRCRDAVALTPGNSSTDSPDATIRSLVGHFRVTPADAQLCYFRSTLLERLDRLNTYAEMQERALFSEDGEDNEDIQGGENEGGEDEDWDDPWAEEPASKPSPSSKPRKRLLMPFSVSTFLRDDLFVSACKLASSEWFDALQVLFDRHGSYLWPLRFGVLGCVPEYVRPTEYQSVIFKFDFSSGMELEPPHGSWRKEVDFSETELLRQASRESGLEPPSPPVGGVPAGMETHPDTLTAHQLADWCKNRVQEIINLTGMVDIGLELAQYGASQGIPDLDELGEDLSLLSRLVYDTHHPNETQDDWTLARWYSMDPPAVVRAYLSNSTPDSLPQDINRLALPYLYVLEARAERAGKPDQDLPNRLLYDYILTSPLELAASVFDASKPTLPAPQRIIKDDEDLARVALACLYGSNSLNEWSTMSRVFECLPAWDYPRGEDNDEDVADTTIASLGAFVAPTTTRDNPTSTDLMAFFKPLHVASLSRALDILDVHLEAGEIFSRWSVPAPLKWFLQSYDDVTEQRAWANRMARRAGGVNDRLNTAEDWEWLLEDMIKLTKKSEAGVKSALGLLDEEEVTGIFFSGLLSAGKFDIARSMLYTRDSKIQLDPQRVEEIVIASSRELYDNASSGNYKIGDMQLAYDCLGVPPSSENLNREKEFIEATSRISSFNVQSRPGIPISPIEIRLTKDRLSLISRILSSNNEAYKHTEVILDLCYKLGFRGDAAAEVKTLAMLADAALQAEDFTRAYEASIRMVNAVKKLRNNQNLDVVDERVREATELCWIGCFQLGRQSEFDDLEKKLQLLGYALELCPPEKLHDVLVAWNRLENEYIAIKEKDLERKGQLDGGTIFLNGAQHLRKRDNTRGNGRAFSQGQMMASATLNVAASSLRSKLQHFHMPSPPLLSTPDAAALASRTFRNVTANFPFSVGQRSALSSRTSHHEHEQYQQGHDGSAHASEQGHHRLDDVSAQASKVLSKGIGWLIGADDE